MAQCLTSTGKAKRRWSTRADAKAAMRQQRAQGIDNADMVPYRCHRCGYFHLGHYPTDEEARAGLRERHRNL